MRNWVCRLFLLFTVCALAVSAHAQSPVLGLQSTMTLTPAAGPLFTQTGSSLTIHGCAAGQSIFYRSDGGLVSIAAPKYSAPFSVTTGEVIVAICATLGGTTSNPTYKTNIQNSNVGAACGVGPAYNPPSQPIKTTTFGPWVCDNNGGVGTVTPSNLVWTMGSTETATITAPASSGSEVQALFKRQFGGSIDPSTSTCDSCTEEVKDIKFTVIGSGMANQENDLPQFDPTHGNTDRQNGTQCEGYGTGAVIEVDSGNAGGWTPTSVSCSNWTAGTTHEIVNRVDHDLTGSCPGGLGCALYKYYWIDGTQHNLNGNYSNSQGYHTNPGAAWGWQFQPDMKVTGASPVTGGWTILSATVALGTGDDSAPKSYTAF